MLMYVDENGQFTDVAPDKTKKVEYDAESIELGIPKQEHIEEDPVKEGRVSFFNDEKGYGFIAEKNSRESYFVHVNGVKQPITEGDNVTFELERGMKGMNAVNVTIVK